MPRTTCMYERLQEELRVEGMLVVMEDQCKDSMEDTSYGVSCKVVVGVVALEMQAMVGSSYTAVQKTAVGAHPPESREIAVVVVVEAKCLAVVVAPVKQTAVEVLKV